MKRTKVVEKQKSRVVAIELKIHQKFMLVYVRRRWPGDKFEWTSYPDVTLASLRRLARLAESIRQETVTG